MAITITQYASTSSKFGDMCIADLDGYFFMIDGGDSKRDAEFLADALGAERFQFILSHPHHDHYGYVACYGKGKIGAPPYQILHGCGKMPELRSTNGKVYLYPRRCIKEDYFPVEIYSPDKEYADINSNSLVTVIPIISDNTVTFFSFGDATQESIKSGFQSILQQINRCPHPIIKLPHHGSAYNCIPLINQLDNSNKKIYYIISGYGGNGINDTMRTVFEKYDKNQLFLLTHLSAKDLINQIGHAHLDIMKKYGLWHTNRVIITEDDAVTISYMPKKIGPSSLVYKEEKEED